VLSNECVLYVCVFQETPASRDPGTRPPPSRPVHLSLVFSLSPSFSRTNIPAKKEKQILSQKVAISASTSPGELELHLRDLEVTVTP
jgi:hypothetical protein